MPKKQPPKATYRLQFNHNFTLKHAMQLIPYFKEMNIDCIYCSPLTQANTGSLHGYDVINYQQLNPDIGNENIFNDFSQKLQQHNMQLLLDFVPNHMSTSLDNLWWQDVLQKNKKSKYADYFDINWDIKDKLVYRRFFDINELVCLRIEKATVFHAVHQKILDWIANNRIQGLRIDHIDGLYDPTSYLKTLHNEIKKTHQEPFYIVIEKILANDESLPTTWPVQGSTGYDFLNAVNAIFIDKKSYQQLLTDYKKLSGITLNWQTLRYQYKKKVINDLFAQEYDHLVLTLYQLLQKINPQEKLKPNAIQQALTEIIACLPIYRTYITTTKLSQQDHRYITNTIEKCKSNHPELSKEFHWLYSIFTLSLPADIDATTKSSWNHWLRRWQQFTGPIMAKGFEDTTCYQFNPLLSLNEVGSGPEWLDSLDSCNALHHFLQHRQRTMPHTLNATTTHDTKRSEDVRARINVLSEIPQEYNNNLQTFITQTNNSIDNNSKIFLYQSLLGSWPIDNSEDYSNYKERINGVMIKATREAKQNTSWAQPNEKYESALIKLIDNFFSQENLLTQFITLQNKVSFYGALNSLSQTLIKITAPGIPDFYQGNESWDYSLVDPDNRRAVDFSLRKAIQQQMSSTRIATPSMLLELNKHWQNGHIKFFLIQKALQVRNQHAKLFMSGEYLPCRLTGKYADNLFAFARQHQDQWTITIVPRLCAKLVTINQFPLGEKVWQDSKIILPNNAPTKWYHCFTNEQHITKNNELYVHAMLHYFPCALLHS